MRVPLSDLLAQRRVSEMVRHLGGSGSARHVCSIVAIEDLAELRELPEDSLAILTRAAAESATGYRLDVAVRVASSRGATAILVPAGTVVSGTSLRVAEQGDLSVLQASEDVNLADLVIGIHRELASGADASLERVSDVLSSLTDVRSARPISAERLIERASELLGVEIIERDPNPGEISVPVSVNGHESRSLVVAEAAGMDARAVRLGLQLVASAVSEVRATHRTAEEIPNQSRAELLSEILVAESTRVGRLLERARIAGLPIDACHTAVCLEFARVPSGIEDEIARYELAQMVARVALDAARARGGIWHRARSGTSLLLVATVRTDPGVKESNEVASTAAAVLNRLRQFWGDASFFCGVGSAHQGHEGLRLSAAEADAAVTAARTTGRLNEVVRYDAAGLRRLLVEWYASDSARRAVDDVLAPLDALGAQRSATATETLRAYFDNQGSVRRTAEALHLHRNAVAYRINRIFETLGMDRYDPDARLMLELACRARTLA